MEVMYDRLSLKVTVTIGGAVYNGSISVDELINEADKNLYKGKTNGRNCVVC